VGAVAGALLLPKIRARMSNNASLTAAALVCAIVLVVLVLVPNAALILVILVPAGVAWIAVPSTINATRQLFLPALGSCSGIGHLPDGPFRLTGPRRRTLGVIAESAGIVWTFLIAAAITLVGAATMRAWPMIDVDPSSVVNALDRVWAPHLRVGRLQPRATHRLAQRSTDCRLRSRPWCRRLPRSRR
jgi:Transmembrane secretion effector